MSLQQLWVAISSLASTSTNHFKAVDKDLRLGPEMRSAKSLAEIRQVLLANTDMVGRQHSSATGVLPNLFHTPMSLQQLRVVVSSLASTSTNHF